MHECAHLRAKVELLYMTLQMRIRRDVALSGGDALLDRIVATDKHIRGIL